MKLAVYTDPTGKITGLAVCRATVGNDPNNPREVSIRAEPLQKHGAGEAGFKTHLVEMPSGLAHETHAQLIAALHSIHSSMHLDLTHSVPALRTRSHESQEH